MSSSESVNDHEILSGFASLQQAMATGFDVVRSDMRAGLAGLENDMRAGFARLDSEILNVRNDVSRLEGRMLRRFDEVDERLDGHDRRIAALEAR
jgi:hypothetical protein